MPISGVNANVPTVEKVQSTPTNTPATSEISGKSSLNFEDTLESTPLLKDEPEKYTNHARHKHSKSPVEDGMAIGFITGSCLSIIGIPVIAVNLLEADKKLSAATSKNLTDILIPFTFPGLLVGVVGGFIGACVGGMVSLCRKIHHGVRKHYHNM